MGCLVDGLDVILHVMHLAKCMHSIMIILHTKKKLTKMVTINISSNSSNGLLGHSEKLTLSGDTRHGVLLYIVVCIVISSVHYL